VPRTATSDIAARTVGMELRRARADAGLTQLQVGARLGTSGSYIANVEAGRENLTLGQMANLAMAVGASLEISFPVVEREPVRVPEATTAAEPA
jgi:transcriptional regulator with XRE-family HTH domain